jgi:predicted MPP superfamily phosphohydrolase
MLAFLPLVFALLGYAWWRIRFIFPRKYRYPGALLLTLCFASNFAYRVVDNNAIAVGMQVIGTITTVFLTNWLLICLLWDLYLGIRRLRGKKRRANKSLRMRREPVLAQAVLALTLAFFLTGIFLQYNYRITTVKVDLATTPKKTLRIAAFSDTHFDPSFPRSKLERIVDSLHILKPDAIFFVGDLADMSAEKLNKRGFDALFKRINAPLGFYAATGNHENIGGSKSIEWLSSLGNVNLLMDSTECNNYFCVSGRLDHHFVRTFGARASLKTLTPDNDSIPWFVLDHQPKGLDKQDTALSRLPDFAVSGHTHAGQFFPAMLVINAMWRLSYGLGNLDGIPWFVTAGIGQWMPIRVGTHSELVMFVFE